MNSNFITKFPARTTFEQKVLYLPGAHPVSHSVVVGDSCNYDKEARMCRCTVAFN